MITAPGDVGFTIVVAVTATYSGGQTATQSSAPTAIVGNGSSYPPTYVQSNATLNSTTSGVTNANATFSSNVLSGDLIVVGVGYRGTLADLATLTDTRGTTFHLANSATAIRAAASAPPGFNYTGVIEWGIVPSGGTDTITATFSPSVGSVETHIHEYNAIGVQLDATSIGVCDDASPENACATTTTDGITSGTATTSFTDELVFGYNLSSNQVNAAGTGFALRTNIGGDITEDKTVSSIGSYAATATQNSAFGWQAIMATFFGTGPNPVPPVNTVLPTIAGTPKTGQIISTTSNGTWTATPPVSSYAYLWQVCNQGTNTCSTAKGSPTNTNSYTVVTGDTAGCPATSNCVLQEVVTATNTAGSASATTAQTAVITAAATGVPVISVLPVVTDTTSSGAWRQGDTLSTTNGTWTQLPTSFTYLWKNCISGVCTTINGATSQTYILQASDIGDTIESIVTASNSFGAGLPATSAAVGPVVGNSGPVISVFISQTGTSGCGTPEFSVADLNANTHSEWAPGKVIGLCGTITTAITAQGSGTTGNPVTVYWEPGAIVQATFCPGGLTGGCVNIANRSFVTLDGGTNGQILSTGNGTNLANHQSTVEGVVATGAHDVTIKNLTIANMYVHAGTADCAAGTDDAIYMASGGSNVTIANNTIHDVRYGFEWQPVSGAGNLDFSGNLVSHSDNLADLIPLASQTTNAVYMHGNLYRDSWTWDTTGDCYHHDGVHLFVGNNAGPSHWTGIYVYDNAFLGNTEQTAAANTWSAEFFVEGAHPPAVNSTEALDSTSHIWFFNNIFSSSDPINDGILWPASGIVSDYNNVIVGSGSSSGVGTQMGSGTANQDDNNSSNFENNAVSSAQQLMYVSQVTSPALWAAGSPNFNVYSNGNANNAFHCIGSFIGFSAAGFTSWKGCVGGAADANSCLTIASGTGNCGGQTTLGINSTTFAPQAGSALLTKGTNLTSVCNGLPSSPVNVGAALCTTYNGPRTDGTLGGKARPTGATAWNVGPY